MKLSDSDQMILRWQIADLWPHRHDAFGVRLMLRSLIRLGRRAR